MRAWSDKHPAGARASDSAPPAGLQGNDFLAAWRAKRAEHGKAGRGGQHRRRTGRGTVPRPGMIRRPPPDDAA